MALKKKVKKAAGPEKKVIRKRRPQTKKVTGKKPVIKRPKEKVLGIVTHYFPKVRAAVIRLKTPLSAGGTIKIKGHTTDFTQKVNSMQIDHVPVTKAKKGDEIGLLVDSRVRKKDIVYFA